MLLFIEMYCDVMLMLCGITRNNIGITVCSALMILFSVLSRVIKLRMDSILLHSSCALVTFLPFSLGHLLWDLEWVASLQLYPVMHNF